MDGLLVVSEEGGFEDRRAYIGKDFRHYSDHFGKNSVIREEKLILGNKLSRLTASRTNTQPNQTKPDSVRHFTLAGHVRM